MFRYLLLLKLVSSIEVAVGSQWVLNYLREIQQLKTYYYLRLLVAV